MIIQNHSNDSKANFPDCTDNDKTADASQGPEYDAKQVKAYKSPNLRSIKEADKESKTRIKLLEQTAMQSTANMNLGNEGSTFNRDNNIKTNQEKFEISENNDKMLSNPNDSNDRSENRKNKDNSHRVSNSYFCQSLTRWLESDSLNEIVNEKKNNSSIEDNNLQVKEILIKLSPILKDWHKQRFINLSNEQSNNQIGSLKKSSQELLFINFRRYIE